MSDSKKTGSKPEETETAEVMAARAKLAARLGGGARIGGKGSMRRKKKVTHRAAATDDKRLQTALKRLNVSNIPSIEEVNLFKKDSTVIHFENPRVQASIQANTYVVNGTSETKSLQELLPDILPQLGPDNLMNLKRLAEQMTAGADGEAAAAADDDDDDDAPPDLEDFEATADE